LEKDCGMLSIRGFEEGDKSGILEGWNIGILGYN
jgi:hypothetical protein